MVNQAVYAAATRSRVSGPLSSTMMSKSNQKASRIWCKTPPRPVMGSMKFRTRSNMAIAAAQAYVKEVLLLLRML